MNKANLMKYAAAQRQADTGSIPIPQPKPQQQQIAPQVQQDAVIYDVYDANDQKNVISPDLENKMYNYCAVTIAYFIDTDIFEEEYGFPFPLVNGTKFSDTITLFVEYSCLDSLNNLSELDIGHSLYEISDGSMLVGYSHSGDFNDERDFVMGELSWYHLINRSESYPHVCIKTTFKSGTTVIEQGDGSHHNYTGLTVDFGIRANPRLWFKGFRTGMSEELFETISAIQPRKE